MKNEKNMVENEKIIVEAVEVSEKKGVMTKVKSGFKKHGKKILAVAGVGAGLLIAYTLGKGSQSSETVVEIIDDLQSEIDFSEISIPE